MGRAFVGLEPTAAHPELQADSTELAPRPGACHDIPNAW
jgi:hypothetical protein